MAWAPVTSRSTRGFRPSSSTSARSVFGLAARAIGFAPRPASPVRGVGGRGLDAAAGRARLQHPVATAACAIAIGGRRRPLLRCSPPMMLGRVRRTEVSAAGRSPPPPSRSRTSCRARSSATRSTRDGAGAPSPSSSWPSSPQSPCSGSSSSRGCARPDPRDPVTSDPWRKSPASAESSSSRRTLGASSGLGTKTVPGVPVEGWGGASSACGDGRPRPAESHLVWSPFQGGHEDLSRARPRSCSTSASAISTPCSPS